MGRQRAESRTIRARPIAAELPNARFLAIRRPRRPSVTHEAHEDVMEFLRDLRVPRKAPFVFDVRVQNRRRSPPTTWNPPAFISTVPPSEDGNSRFARMYWAPRPTTPRHAEK